MGDTGLIVGLPTRAPGFGAEGVAPVAIQVDDLPLPIDAREAVAVIVVLLFTTASTATETDPLSASVALTI